MTRAEFSRRILLDFGGTYADVNRLDEEGWANAAVDHFSAWKAGELYGIEKDDEAAFSELCYSIGREFVLDNMGEIFNVEHPESANEQRAINIYRFKIRQIGNIALCLSEYAGQRESEYKEITWADVAEVGAVLSRLRGICDEAGIEIKEV